VVDSRPDTQGLRYLRWRHCDACHQLFETAEAATGKILPLHDETTTTKTDDEVSRGRTLRLSDRQDLRDDRNEVA